VDGKPAPPAAELARRFPLTPARAFKVAHGARRLFAPEAAAVVYVDGRRMQPLLQALVAQDRRTELRYSSPAQRAAVAAKQRARDQRCAVWKRAPTIFDDVGVALAAAPDGLSLSWAWGTQSGAPLGGLHLHADDDAGLDVDALGADATAVVALYAASLAPFAALRRSGPFASTEALYNAVEPCDMLAAATVFVRSWPLAIGAFAASASAPKSSDASALATAQKSVSSLRNVVVALRDFTSAGPRAAIAATFDAAARPLIEGLLTGSGASGAVTTIGKRSPTVYPLELPGFPRQLAAALESLAGGKIGVTVADSNESLTWALRTGGLPTSAPAGASRAVKPPLLRVAADLSALAKLGPLLNAGPDEQPLLDLLGRLRRVDGELVADGDLFRLTLRSPLKQ
jgi:hypothetical protein